MSSPEISAIVDRARAGLQSGRPVWVSGPTGSGRTTLAHRLAECVPGAALVQLPSPEFADAGAAVAMLAWSAIEPGERGGTAPEADAISRRLSLQNTPLVVRVPASWAPDPEPRPHQRYARRVLAHLARLQRVVWVADAGLEPSEVGVTPGLKLDLEPHRTGFPEQDWGDYQPAAEALRAHVLASVDASPLLWRFAVGAVALGANAAVVASWCTPANSALRRIADLLADRLHRSPDAAAAVDRFRLARKALPTAVALDVAQPPAGHDPLITECVGYGDPVRVSPYLSEVVLETPQFDSAAVHARLADHYERLDGVANPEAIAGWGQMSAWLEKVHHYAHAGELRADRWSAQDLPRRELYWDRARYFSIDRKDYGAAAAIYQQCLERFPEDDYAAHYLAWNLHRQHRSPTPEALRWFRRAVELSPRHPWWSARLVTTLIESKDWIGARRAWESAMAKIDPDGVQAERDPWLVAHLHDWVAEAWMKAGVWYEARSVLATLSESAVQTAEQRRPELAELRERIKATAQRENARFDSWLRRRRDPRWTTARSVWRDLKRTENMLPPPIAGDGEDGPRFAWSHPGVFLELEVFEDGQIDWYARDRVQETDADSNGTVTPEDPRLLPWLNRVAHG